MRLANLCFLLDEVAVTALAEIIVIPSAMWVVPIAFFCYHGLSGSVVTVVAALDNLGKGAAGQAVQNMNLMLGFDPGRGIRC